MIRAIDELTITDAVIDFLWTSGHSVDRADP